MAPPPTKPRRKSKKPPPPRQLKAPHVLSIPLQGGGGSCDGAGGHGGRRRGGRRGGGRVVGRGGGKSNFAPQRRGKGRAALRQLARVCGWGREGFNGSAQVERREGGGGTTHFRCAVYGASALPTPQNKQRSALTCPPSSSSPPQRAWSACCGGRGSAPRASSCREGECRAGG